LGQGCAWPAGYSEGIDDRTVITLRFGMGIIGSLLPIALIVWNKIAGDSVTVPASMSGSYYTSSRNLFAGALCALGVFLIGYRDTERLWGSRTRPPVLTWASTRLARTR